MGDGETTRLRRVILALGILSNCIVTANADDFQQINITSESPTNITSPGYGSSNGYPTQSFTTWVITAPQGTIISARILDFQVEGHNSARDDLFIGSGLNYTTVYEGYRLPPDKSVGDRGEVRQIISSGPEMWMVFKTDVSNNPPRDGFKIQLSVLSETESCASNEFGCHDVILVCMDERVACDGPPHCADESDEMQCEHCGQTDIDLSVVDTYNLTSPEYPNDVPYEILCHWLVTARDDAHVLLSFVNFILDENQDSFSVGTGHDPSNMTSLVLKRSVSVTPMGMVIKSNRIWLAFKTTGHQTLLSVLQISLRVIKPIVCQDGEFPCESGLECVPQAAVCNELPDCLDHSDELNCHDSPSCHGTCSCLERGNICNGVADCPDYYDELFCEPCGDPFIQLTNNDTIVNLTSPRYPSLYPREMSCIWLITASKNHRIRLRFLDFKLNVEILSVGDGHRPSDENSLIMQRFGVTTPVIVTSAESKMWITFETFSVSSIFRGYFLQISQFVTVECGADEFRCTSGTQCLPNTHRCDDISQCLDFTDEIGCDDSCPADHFSCQTSACLVPYGLCDGTVDCENFKDETGCDTMCGERNIELTKSLPVYNLSSVELTSLDILTSAYPPRYSCLWTVTTTSSLQIILKIMYIKLHKLRGDVIILGNGHDPSIRSTRIAIFDGDDDKIVLGRTYLSSDSTMWITKMAIDDSPVIWRAFQFVLRRYNSSGECNEFRCRHDSHCIPESAVCDGIANCGDYSDEHHCEHCGVEHSTDIDLTYTTEDAPHILSVILTNEAKEFRFGKDCLWVITAPSGSRIQIRFLHILLLSDSYYINGIVVGNGHNPVHEFSVIMSSSGKVIPEIVTSSNATMWITVNTYYLQFVEGFSAALSQYHQRECSPDQYMCPSGLKCIDQSQVCDGEPDCPELEDEFGCGICSFDLLRCDEGAKCLERSLVCNGEKDCTDRLDERICAPCGDFNVTLPRDTSQPMEFSLPSYGIVDYPSRTICVWFITGQPHYHIQIEFLSFRSEVKSDTLRAGNGHSPGDTDSQLLTGISGTEAPRIIVSEDHYMWIKFTTDIGKTDKGFLLSITQQNETVECNEDEMSCPNVPGVVCLLHKSRCNGIPICPDGSDEDPSTCGSCGPAVIYLFGTATHNLTSPAYPSVYPSDQQCGWLIQTYEKPSDNELSTTDNPWRLSATIVAFDLENQYDYLSLFNYEDDQATDIIAKLTGRVKLTTVVSSGPAMFIRFTSDKTGARSGFKIRFQPINHNATISFCEEGDFDCANNAMCVSDDAKCNGFNDCLDYKDEISCSEINCPGDYECASSITTDADLVNFQCITMDLVCNGRTDCPKEDDEIQCDKKKCPADCDCFYDNNGLAIMCSGSWDQNTVDVIAKTVYTLSLTGGNVTVLRKGTFKGMLSLHTLSLSNNNIKTVEPRTFDGLDNLTWLDISGNQIDELQSYSFQELRRLEGLTLWNVPVNHIRDYAFSGLQNLQKLAIVRGVKNKAAVAIDAFEGIPHLQELIVDDHRLCCYFPGVTCTSLEPRPPLFMCSNLMPNTALRIFMWILGISALVGNLGVILWRFREKNSKSSKIVHSFLVFNLAVSDLLMGVYMLIIASFDIYYGDEYFLHASEWRSSIGCKIASAISILSSEASVFIVTVITVDRFLCIVLPFSQFHLRRKSSRITLFIVWCVALTVSLVPTLLADEESNFYGLSDVCIGLPLRTRPTTFSQVTKNVGSPISNGTFSIPVALTYEPSWVFSIILFLGVNLLCFLTILICYVVIFIHVQISVKQVNRHMHRFEEIKMAAKMGLIVGTDLLCWLPIIVMGIAAQFNVIIPVEMYAWSVVFILPINSSLNPYLYTVSSCIADRRRGQKSMVTMTKRSGTMPPLPMTDKVNFEKSLQTQEFSVID
ncbi:uncharacterized protein LOC117298251 [Asterias rubens]|uniref:uncharacterized protein LOC117298251 n=1 Tax=Asterias rubens TaxID=7604 RepID=UPI001455BD15|nr:uncharacterized protein LOC117298251 [Asterias rubens]